MYWVLADGQTNALITSAQSTCLTLDSLKHEHAHLEMDVVQHSPEDFREDKDSFHGSKIEGIGHHQGCARGLCLRWLPGYGGYQAVQVHHLHHTYNIYSTSQRQCHGCSVCKHCVDHSAYFLVQVYCHRNTVYSTSTSAEVTKTASKIANSLPDAVVDVGLDKRHGFTETS